MTDDDVHSSLVRWLRTTLGGITVIKSRQSGPVPGGRYVAVNLTGTVEVRDHAKSLEFTESAEAPSGEPLPIIATPVIETEWWFSLHAYGEHPTDLLRPIRSAAQLPQIMEPLMPSLIIHDLSTIRHVPDWKNEEWRPRAQMDVMLRGLTRDGFVIDTIETAPIDVATF